MPPEGDTWEPASNLEGEEAEAAITLFKERRAEEQTMVT